jgi:DNA-binding transcriptional regulator YhcF (GntR family)
MMRSMRIRIDPSSRVPVSEQLARGVRARIQRGALARGTRVPSVRELALELGLAANTVAKAYRMLEAEGLLVGRGRSGTFVTDRPTDGSPEMNLAEAAGAFVDRARELGFGPTAARRALDRALRRP